MNRRSSIIHIAQTAGIGFLSNYLPHVIAAPLEQKFKISLAEWSLNKTIFSGEIDHLDFAATARSMGFEAIEYVNQFFKDKADDEDYLNMMNQKAEEHNVKQLLIMIDEEGYLGDLDKNARLTAVQNHYKWVKAAMHLGCHSIRVNAFGKGSAEEVKEAAIDGLSRLSTYAAPLGINVIVENHGSYSSNGSWIADVMASVDMNNCGTLPDFGNFCIKREGGKTWDGQCIEEYDKYQGVDQMMPYAKAVSAKAKTFETNGEEKTIDFSKMIDIMLRHGYNGYVGVEYEGDDLTEREGILATKKLLERYQ